MSQTSENPPDRSLPGHLDSNNQSEEGLPPLPRYSLRKHQESEYGATVWLFTCVSCGERWIDPQDPPNSPHHCDTEAKGEIVCHGFGFAEYNRIRWYSDPRAFVEIE